MPDKQEAASLAASPEAQAFLAYPGTAVLVTTVEGDILWASPSCLQVLGWPPNHLVGRNGWTTLAAPEDLRDLGRLSAMLAEGDLVAWARLVRGDGAAAWFRADVLRRKGLLVAAVRPEADRARHRFHSEHRQAGRLG